MADVPKDIMEAAIAVHEAMMRADIEDEPLILARALLSERERRTAQGVTVPEGWKLVPIEPTEAMMNAGLYQSGHDAEWADVYSAWRDMVSFAPSLSTSAGGGERG